MAAASSSSTTTTVIDDVIVQDAVVATSAALTQILLMMDKNNYNRMIRLRPRRFRRKRPKDGIDIARKFLRNASPSLLLKVLDDDSSNKKTTQDRLIKIGRNVLASVGSSILLWNDE